MRVSTKDVYCQMFAKYPDVVSVTQLAQMLDERLNMAGMERYLAIIADNSSKGIYLEDGTLVGHLLPAIDSGLAKYSMRGGRGNR